jgi:MtN3 and saliva related transmembrane protein
MLDQMMNIFGIIGNALLTIAYIPQIMKLVKTKKGEDLSLLMWICYLVGDLFLATYAVYTRDLIFFTLFTLFTFFNIIVLYLTIKYSKKGKIEILKEL